MLEFPNISLGYDPEQELRRWAIEQAAAAHWDNDCKDTVKLAKKFLDFVKGETE